jgi:hypothetical protein
LFGCSSSSTNPSGTMQRRTLPSRSHFQPTFHRVLHDHYETEGYDTRIVEPPGLLRGANSSRLFIGCWGCRFNSRRSRQNRRTGPRENCARNCGHTGKDYGHGMDLVFTIAKISKSWRWRPCHVRTCQGARRDAAPRQYDILDDAEK